MTSAAIPELLPRMLWQQAVTEDNSTCCIGLYANAVQACTVSMQTAHLHCHVEQDLLFCWLKTYNSTIAGMLGKHNHWNSAQAQLPVQHVTMCYASCQSACPHNVSAY